MMEEVNTLPSEIAFRKEADVRQKIVSFYIRKIKPTPVPPGPGPNPVPPTPPEPPMPPTNYVKDAKDKVKVTNMPNMMWQKVILELIDEYPNVAEFIDKYLS
jgi:hypothetical protein